MDNKDINDSKLAVFAMLENPQIFVDLAKNGKVETLNNYFDKIFKYLKDNIKETSLEWCKNCNTGEYNTLSLLETTIRQTEYVNVLYDTCVEELKKYYAKQNGETYKNPTKTEVEKQKNLHDLDTHNLMQKLAREYVCANLEDKNFSNIERLYNRQKGEE